MNYDYDYELRTMNRKEGQTDGHFFSATHKHIFIYTSLFHQRNGSSKNTYNIINKENTISKHKVNMTVISLVKNMTIKL